MTFSKGHRETLAAYVFLVPLLAGLLIFRVLPIVQAAWISLFEYSLLSEVRTFAGSGNYLRAFRGDPLFYQALKVSLVYTMVRVPLQLTIGLFLAMLVQQRLAGMRVLRAILFTPVVTSMVIVSVIWGLLYHPQGIINGALGLLGVPPQPFLVSPTQALWAVLAMTVWKDVGFTMLIFLAGLQGIPQDYYEVASIDGANLWQRFRHITLPLLSRTVTFLLVTTTVFALQLFTPIYIMTEGGPMDSTLVYVYYVFKSAFVYMRMGYASALSLILFLVILVLSLIQLKATQARFEY